MSIDDRLSERMNWEGPTKESAEAFLAEWQRTVVDREYVPASGDSSKAAAARLGQFLDDADRRLPDGPIAVVTHGGVTIDLLHDLMGDERLDSAVPGLLGRGMPPGGLTILAGSHGTWRILGIGERRWE